MFRRRSIFSGISQVMGHSHFAFSLHFLLFLLPSFPNQQVDKCHLIHRNPTLVILLLVAPPFFVFFIIMLPLFFMFT